MTTTAYLADPAHWNPVVIAGCVAAAIAYGAALGARISARAGYFAGALAVLVLAIGSPLAALAAGYVFAAHMLQHMLLLLIVPVLGWLSLPASCARPDSRWQRVHVPPLAAWLGGVGAMWIWHDRSLCELATDSAAVRIIQVVSLLVLGGLFWSPLAGPALRHRVSPLAGVIYLFTACLACSVLGILITFAPAGTVCPAFLRPPHDPAVLHLIRSGWGLTPGADQQIGGLLMWVPGCGIYLLGVVALLARWYGAAEPSET